MDRNAQKKRDQTRRSARQAKRNCWNEVMPTGFDTPANLDFDFAQIEARVLAYLDEER